MDGYKYELAQQNRIYNSLKIYFLYFQIKKKWRIFWLKNLNIIDIKVAYIKFKYKHL